MSKKKMMPIEEGQLVLVSSGAYSDYMIHGVYRTTRQIDVEEELSEFLKENPEARADFAFDKDAFFQYIGGALERVTGYRELHLGDYSRASEVDVWLPDWAENGEQS